MLTEIQARLDQHFLSLSRQRAEVGYPVYALEHGLDSSEIHAVRTALARELTLQEALSIAHWLPWVVVATEIGYSYNGDEYWNSFAQAIPDWEKYGDRTTIRDWFALFANRYRGFRPTGRWAQHFSIIAWPIAHAILPRDLQGQFARHLYDLRYELASRPNASIEELGLILEDVGPIGSQRFQHFLGQTELTARLLLALRDEDVQDAIPAIHRPTLARIVADLEGRQSARDWLREARTTLRDARMRGSATLLGSRTGSAPAHGEPRSDGSNSVRLVARQSSEGAWFLGIRLPDLAQMIKQTGLNPRTLDQTRVRLANRPNQWMPGRALLTLAPSEQRILSLHDLIRGPVLILERDVQGFSNFLLSDALRIKGSSPWLLRIQDDGVARQVLGNHVRTSQSYLIISDIPLPSASIRDLNLHTVQSDLRDVEVYFLTVPRVLTPNELAALKTVKIGYALRANIEPLGLVPRWDGTNECTVWLTTEEPLLRLSADHPIQEFTVSVDQHAIVRIPVGNPPDAIISLGHLAVGSHVVEVGGTASGKPGIRLEPERLELAIRAPIPWAQGVRDHAGFRPILEPPGASLANVLAGKARLAVLGPPERPVTIDVRLFNFNGHLTEHCGLGTVASLTDEAALRRLLAKLAKEPLAEKVQSAPRVDIAFLADELGMDSLSFSHKVCPFRWRLSIESQEYRVRLIDEAGADHPVVIRRYELTQPDRQFDADYTQCLIGQVISPPGALVTAICDNEQYSVIVSVPSHQKLRTLNDLAVTITVSPTNNEPKHIPQLLQLLRLWGRAQQVLGPLGMLRQAQVCDAIERRIATNLCGRSWVERAHRCRSIEDASVDQLRREIGGSPGFGARLRQKNWHYTDDDQAVRAEFTRLAATYQVSDDPELCVLALRAAFDPAAITFDTPDRGVTNWVNLAQVPILARGAFFARRITDLTNHGLFAAEVA